MLRSKTPAAKAAKAKLNRKSGLQSEQSESDVDEGPHIQFLIKTFDRVQRANSNDTEDAKKRLLIYFNSLKNTNGVPDPLFIRNFIEVLQMSLFCPENSIHGDKVIKFAANFSISTDQGDAELKNEDGQREIPMLARSILSYFSKNRCLNEGNQRVRVRVCQVLENVIACSSTAELSLSQEDWEAVEVALLTRLKDKSIKVQMAAIRAVAFLQVPIEETLSECRVTSSLLAVLMQESSHEVRECAMRSIFVNKLTLSYVIERTCDVHDKVRKAAFQVLEKEVSMRRVRFRDRMTIFRNGLNDQREDVVKACEELIEVWLNEEPVGGNLLQLLENLDLINEQETSKLVFCSVLARSDIDKRVQDFISDEIFGDNERKTLKLESVQTVFYWTNLVEFVRDKVGEPNRSRLLEKVLPTGCHMIQYVQEFIHSKFVDLLEAESAKTAQPVDRVKLEFMAKSLVSMMNYTEDGDNYARNLRREMLEGLISKDMGSTYLMDSVVEQYLNWHISEANGGPLDGSALLGPAGEGEVDCHLAVLFVSEVLADLVSPDSSPSTVETEGKEINEDTAMMTTDEILLAADADRYVVNAESAMSEDDLLTNNKPSSTVPPSSTDPANLSRGLSILNAVLKTRFLTSLDDNLKSFIRTLVAPCLTNENGYIREHAFCALSFSMMLSPILAREFFPLLLKAYKTEAPNVRIMLMKGTLDLTVIHGLSLWESITNEDIADIVGGENIESSKEENPSARVVQFYLSTMPLDRELSAESLVVIEGLCKLLMEDIFFSPQLFAHLVALWFSPLSEPQPYVRGCLGTFILLFAFSSKVHMECVGNSFQSVIQRTPSDEWEKVGKFMVHLTLTENLAQLKLISTTDDHAREQINDGSVHWDMAIGLIQHVLYAPNVLLDCVRFYTQIVSELTLDKTGEDQKGLLAKYCNGLLTKFNDKLIKRNGYEGDETPPNPIVASNVNHRNIASPSVFSSSASILHNQQPGEDGDIDENTAGDSKKQGSYASSTASSTKPSVDSMTPFKGTKRRE